MALAKIAHLTMLFMAAAAQSAYAADTKILDHHVRSMKAGNVAAIMSDYADDAVVVTPAGMITPSGVFTSRQDARRLFSVLTDKSHLPADKSMQTRYEVLSPDTILMHWVQLRGTAQQVSGTDVFVLRGGKIVFQDVAVDAPKK